MCFFSLVVQHLCQIKGRTDLQMRYFNNFICSSQFSSIINNPMWLKHLQKGLLLLSLSPVSSSELLHFHSNDHVNQLFLSLHRRQRWMSFTKTVTAMTTERERENNKKKRDTSLKEFVILGAVFGKRVRVSSSFPRARGRKGNGEREIDGSPNYSLVCQGERDY